MTAISKPYGSHRWVVEVRSLPQPLAGKAAQRKIYGTIEDALCGAEELECDVDFEVRQFIITRKEKNK